MNPYITQLKTQLADWGGDDILEFLWLHYSASNPVDNDAIHVAERALAPIFEDLSLNSSNILFDRISDLCIVYQRAAFLEGVRLGFQLFSQLSE